MRPMYVIGASIAVLAVAGVLAWTRFAPAQTPPPAPPLGPGEVMAITVKEVEVRSGPSQQFYATSKLRLGDRVEVVKSDKGNPGWLAIKPPQGSQSWINAAFVQHSKTSSSLGTVVTAPDAPVPVKAASNITDKVPDVETGKAERGTQVVIMGKEHVGDN